MPYLTSDTVSFTNSMPYVISTTSTNFFTDATPSILHHQRLAHQLRMVQKEGQW
jgi:hypothetical protein